MISGEGYSTIAGTDEERQQDISLLNVSQFLWFIHYLLDTALYCFKFDRFLPGEGCDILG